MFSKLFKKIVPTSPVPGVPSTILPPTAHGSATPAGSLDATVRFQTDAATLAIFDPECLRTHVGDECDWWCGPLGELPEVQQGVAAFISTAGDGVFQVRITDGDLTPDERDYALQKVTLGLEVKSGTVFVGAGECISGGGTSPTVSDLSGLGQLVGLAPGAYNLDVFLIDWSVSPRWWAEEGVHPDAPADIAVLLRQREGVFSGTPDNPRLDALGTNFLFEAGTRRIGPEPGMVLTTEVRKSPTALTLKSCGPCSYKPIMECFTGLEWHDKVRVKVLTVDPVQKTMTVSLVEKMKVDPECQP